MDKSNISIKYGQKFGSPGEVPSDEVNARLDGINAFLEGYFLAVSNERHEDVVSPSVSNLSIMVSYDQKIDYTRIGMDIIVTFNDVQSGRQKILQHDTINALNLFLSKRFSAC